MTIVFSAASPYLIAMTSDSAVTLDFGDSREYSTGRKSYSFPGIGCISTWGARDGNRIGEFLNKVGILANKHSVIDLANYVYDYLTQEYKPDQIGLGDLGYHVAGFDRDGSPKLFHVFWGFDQPRPPTQTKQEYKINDHSPKNGEIFFLYNGRNDIAHFMVYLLLDQINRGNSTRFNFGHPADLSNPSCYQRKLILQASTKSATLISKPLGVTA